MERATAAYEKEEYSILELSLYENCFHLDHKDSSYTRKIYYFPLNEDMPCVYLVAGLLGRLLVIFLALSLAKFTRSVNYSVTSKKEWSSLTLRKRSCFYEHIIVCMQTVLKSSLLASGYCWKNPA